MTRLGALVAIFALLALVILVLQYIPLTGFFTSVLMGPYWIGLILHGFLLAILALAIAGALPRWGLIIPLVVWAQGLAGWQLGMRSAEQSVARLSEADRIAAGDAKIVVFGNQRLAQALAAGYRTGEVYSDLYRESLASGPECAPTANVEINRPVLRLPALLARGTCLASVRADPPKAGAVEVHVRNGAARTTPEGDRFVAIDIVDTRRDPPTTRRLEAGVAAVPAPLLVPVLGWVYGSRDLDRAAAFGIWRVDHPVPAVPSWSGDVFAEPMTGAVAEALRLEPR